MSELYLQVEMDAPGKPNESASAFKLPLGELPCTVGRGVDCQLQLDFQRVSREHARFERQGDELKVVDLGSTNGTFVNHQRIDSSQRVRIGDTIHFGNHPFVLLESDSATNGEHPAPVAEAASSHDTVIGFTAQPTGFPVQAPEFFELLNDEQIVATAQAVVTASGTKMATSLRARSNHPGLDINSDGLFKLAEDLGEEVRLAQMIRRLCLEQVAQSNLQSTMLLQVHAAECEELDLFIDEWLALAKQFRHVDLACELPLNAFSDPADLITVKNQLEKNDIEICGVATGLPADRLADFRGHLDYLRVSALSGPDRIPALVDALGSFVRILVDQISEVELIRPFSEAGASLFQGEAVDKVIDLSDA